jgi:hypothetical protein
MGLVHINKPAWRREYEREHYLYVLYVIVEDVKLELAGVEWDYGSKKPGWRIAQIGIVHPLKDGWCSVDRKLYRTARDARFAAEELLRRIVERVG